MVNGAIDKAMPMRIKERGPHYEVVIAGDVQWCHVLSNGLGTKFMRMDEAREVIPLIQRALARWDEEMKA
jgi:hypothetical protein